MRLDDLRYAVRRLSRRPLTTVVSVITLACGVGASVAAWSLLSAVLLRPLPVSEPERLVSVGVGPRWSMYFAHRYQLYRVIRDGGFFDQVAGASGPSAVPVTMDGATDTRQVFLASHNFLDVIGIRVQTGRWFTPDDDRIGAPAVAVLSDRFWRRAFHADPTVLSRQVIVAGQPVAIVGIAPANFRGLDLAHAPDLYVPLHTQGLVFSGELNRFSDATTSSPGAQWVRIIGRLKPDANAAVTAERLNILPKDIVGPRPIGLMDINTASLPEATRPPMVQFARLLGATVLLLLTIGCLTVGMLVLLRTEARRDELATCLALGASRARLASGIILEGLLLSIVGAALALPVSGWMLAGVRSLRLPGGIAVDLLEIPIDAQTLAVTVAGAVAATLLITLVAGAFGVPMSSAGALNHRAGVTPRVGRRRTRAALVIAQVAVALVLLSGAGLFVRSLTSALSLNPGHDTERIVTGAMALGRHGYAAAGAEVFFADLYERLSRSPAIQAVSFTASRVGRQGNVLLDGQPRDVPSILFRSIDERYFTMMGLQVLQGRDFTRADLDAAPSRTAIVGERLARALGQGGDVVGRLFTFGNVRRPGSEFEVIGVVPDVIDDVRMLEPHSIYMPMRPFPEWYTILDRTLVFRAASNPDAAIRVAIETIRSMDPAIAPPRFTTMADQLAQQMSPQRFGATVLGALGGIAALLTFFGIYVLAESMAAQRRREMGVRAALGATGRQLSALVLAETGRLIFLGLAAGLVLVGLGTGLIRSFLFGVSRFDTVTLVGVTVTMLIIAMLVSLRPALRAGQVDLARVLREE